MPSWCSNTWSGRGSTCNKGKATLEEVAEVWGVAAVRELVRVVLGGVLVERDPRDCGAVHQPLLAPCAVDVLQHKRSNDSLQGIKGCCGAVWNAMPRSRCKDGSGGSGNLKHGILRVDPRELVPYYGTTLAGQV